MALPAAFCGLTRPERRRFIEELVLRIDNLLKQKKKYTKYTLYVTIQKKMQGYGRDMREGQPYRLFRLSSDKRNITDAQTQTEIKWLILNEMRKKRRKQIFFCFSFFSCLLGIFMKLKRKITTSQGNKRMTEINLEGMNLCKHNLSSGTNFYIKIMLSNRCHKAIKK